MRKLGLVFVLVGWVAPAWATVITTGDVDPGGAGTQPDPWSIEGDLYVGDTGYGTLNIEAGGQVSNEKGRIGYESGSTGIVTVAGAGSKWTSSEILYVGNYGSGTLTVEAGGEVYNTSGRIGSKSGSTGVATVTGAGSTWANTISLQVGAYGDGTLNVEAGGACSRVCGCFSTRRSQWLPRAKNGLFRCSKATLTRTSEQLFERLSAGLV